MLRRLILRWRLYQAEKKFYKDGWRAKCPIHGFDVPCDFHKHEPLHILYNEWGVLPYKLGIPYPEWWKCYWWFKLL